MTSALIALIKPMSLTVLDILHRTSRRRRIVFIGNRDSGLYVEIFQKRANTILFSFGVSSDNLVDYWVNSQCLIESCDQKYSMHSGIHYQLQSIFPTLVAYVLQCRPGTSFFFTGHSRGGALALLCGVHVANRFPMHMVHVVTTGTPKIGNRHLKDWYDGAAPNLYVDRVVIDQDWVPRWSLRSSYVHFGKERRLIAKDSFLHWKKNHSRITHLALLEEQYLPHLMWSGSGPLTPKKEEPRA